MNIDNSTDHRRDPQFAAADPILSSQSQADVKGSIGMNRKRFDRDESNFSRSTAPA